MRAKPSRFFALQESLSRLILPGFIALAVVGGWWVYATYYAEKPRERRLAADGEFFLQTYASARTAHGVVGIPVGEWVRRVNGKAPPGMVKVTDGRYTFDVYPSQLTDDVELAASLAARDGEAQRQLANRLQSDKLLASHMQSEMDERHANDVARFNSQDRNASVVGTYKNLLVTGATVQIGLNFPHFYTLPSSPRESAPLRVLPLRVTPIPNNNRYVDDPMTRLRKASGGPGPPEVW